MKSATMAPPTHPEVWGNTTGPNVLYAAAKSGTTSFAGNTFTTGSTS